VKNSALYENFRAPLAFTRNFRALEIVRNHSRNFVFHTLQEWQNSVKDFKALQKVHSFGFRADLIRLGQKKK